MVEKERIIAAGYGGSNKEHPLPIYPNHDIFKKECEYSGQTFRKGDYISRDTLHHEWEFFRGPKNHLGAINSLTGILNTAKKDKSRVFRLP